MNVNHNISGEELSKVMDRAMDRVFSNFIHEVIANKCGVGRTTVSMWKRNGRIPAQYILAVESLTGVSRYKLRPDIYGDEPEEEDQAAA